MKTMNSGQRVQARRVGGAGFDPAVPADHSLIVAGVLRDQFQGLQEMIEAVPVVSGAVVDGVTTLPAGSPAEASAVLEAGALHFAFGIPQGAEGREGATGETGPQGPPFAQAVVDGVSTLPPGDAATVGVSFDGTDVHFSFGIPQGAKGEAGDVSLEQLNLAIAGTSANSNAVQVLPFNATPNYDPEQFQAVIDKVNELILALRR